VINEKITINNAILDDINQILTEIIPVSLSPIAGATYRLWNRALYTILPGSSVMRDIIFIRLRTFGLQSKSGRPPVNNREEKERTT